MTAVRLSWPELTGAGLGAVTGQAGIATRESAGRGPGPNSPPLDLEHAATTQSRAKVCANACLYHGPGNQPTSQSVTAREGHFNAQAGVGTVSRLHTRTDGLVALVSQAALQAWRKLMGVVGADWRPRPDRGSTPELCYLQAMARLRTDSLAASERLFAKLLEAHPTAFYAVEEHAAILDRLGWRDRALAGYERARTGRQLLKRGMPDRPFFRRHHTTSVAEINGYTNVLRAGPSKRGAFVHVARGHAYLATRRPRLALLDYDAALKLRPDQTHLFGGKRRSAGGIGPACRGLAGP